MAADPGDYIRRIRLQVGTMSRLVDDLFELSRLTEGAAVALRAARTGGCGLRFGIRCAGRSHRTRYADHPFGVAGITVWADPTN